MSNKEKVYLFDRSERRRAHLCSLLTGEKYHVEPCHDPKDYRLGFGGVGIALVRDEDNAVAEVVQHLSSASSFIPTLAYDSTPLVGKVVRAMNAGAIDYLEWPFDCQIFESHIKKLDMRLSAARELKLREQRARERWSALTSREKQVLQAMSDGKTNFEIANKLSISPRTVEIHRTNLIKKMGAKRSADAVRSLVEARLTSPIE